jgi:hypothetical protein
LGTDTNLNQSNATVYSLDPNQFPNLDFVHKNKMFVGPGNNERCIRRVMAKREWWKIINEHKKKKDKIEKKVDLETLKNQENADFIWVQTTREANYDSVKTLDLKLFNHFPHHTEISSKFNLFNNLNALCNVR